MRILLMAMATAAVLCAGPALAQTKPAGDPLLGDRIVEGVASSTRLWLGNADGAVVAFDRGTGARKVVATRGVRDLVRAGGVTVALQAVGGRVARLAVTNLETGKRLTPAFDGPAAALARAGDDWVVLGKNAVLRSNGGPWRRQAFAAPWYRSGVTVMAATPDGTVWVGHNWGEWGGGLWRLAPGASAFTEINSGDPVTAVVADPERKDCVLASVGLAHIVITRGRVVRVCGDKVELLFSKRLEAAPGSFEAVAGNVMPVWGLIVSPGGWTGVSNGRLIVSKGGEVAISPAPRLAPWSGLLLAQADGVILTTTDVNWNMSVSGYTPLLIPVSD